MRAVVIRRHGPPESLRVEDDVPVPEIGPNDALIRVGACALNHLDLWARSGPPENIFPWRERKLPHISGVDAAGTVERVGSAVTGLEPGTRAVLYSSLSCGDCEYCRMGEETMCLGYHIFGEQTQGGLAEYAVIPAKNVYPLPDDYPFERAAALPAAYTTAWRALITAGRLRPSEDVLIVGVGGGVGSAALQIASMAGARVFVLAGDDWKIDQARVIGADAGFNYNEGPFSEWVLSVTNGRGVDIVLDPVGAPTWPESIRSLARGGRMVICGATAGSRPDIDIREIYQRHRQIIGAPMGNRRDFEAMLKAALGRRFDPIIDRIYPLDEIAEAHRRLESRQSFGKVVIRVG